MDTDAATGILQATHCDLCKHGYADLALQKITAEMDANKVTNHYYYDSNADLFTAFLEYFYDQNVGRIASVHSDRPRERLQSLLGVLLARVQLNTFNRVLYNGRRSIITDGVDKDVFDEHVNPALTTEFLMAAISGAHTRHAAVGYPMDRLHEAVRRYAVTHLVNERSEVTY